MLSGSKYVYFRKQHFGTFSMANAINNIYVNFSFKTQIMHFTHLLISLHLNKFNYDFRCIV